MTIDKNFIDQFIKVTSKAALSSSYLVVKKDKIVVVQAITTIAAASITNLGYEPRNSLSA